jgi:hypothetical protein
MELGESFHERHRYFDNDVLEMIVESSGIRTSFDTEHSPGPLDDGEEVTDDVLDDFIPGQNRLPWPYRNARGLRHTTSVLDDTEAPVAIPIEVVSE